MIATVDLKETLKFWMFPLWILLRKVTWSNKNMTLRAMFGWTLRFAFSTSCAGEGYKYSCRRQHRQMSQMSLTSNSKSLGNMFQIDLLWNS